MRSLLALVLLAPLGAVAANQHYLGYAYDSRDGAERYREEHWVVREGGRQLRLVLYRCPGGAAFARKWVRGAIDDPAPDFALYDQRDGYREGVDSRHGARYVYVQAHAGAPMQSQKLRAVDDAVVDAGFDAWLRANWQPPAAPLRFLLPSRLDWMPLTVQARDAAGQGSAASGCAWMPGMALPPLPCASPTTAPADACCGSRGRATCATATAARRPCASSFRPMPSGRRPRRRTWKPRPPCRWCRVADKGFH